jgi:hypothetical protein
MFPKNCLIISVRFSYQDGHIITKMKKDFENLQWSDRDADVMTNSARIYVEKLIKNRMFW